MVRNIANTSGFQLIPAVFSHTGQIHTVFKDFIREQIRQKFVHFENQAKPSKINSVFMMLFCERRENINISLG